MKAKLLVTTATVALMLSTGAYAQTPSIDTGADRPNVMQSHTDRHSGTDTDRTNARDNDRTKRPQTTGQAPGGTTSSDSKASSDNKAGSDTSSNKPAAAQDSTGGGKAASERKANSNVTRDDKDASSSRDKQANEPRSGKSNSADQGDKNRPAAAQRETPNDSKQQSTSSGSTDRNRQSASDAKSEPNTRVSASLRTEQKTRLSEAVTKLDAKPVTNVNFSISVGTAVPGSVSLRPVPRTIVSIVPQYEGYNYFLVRDEVVIVEPRTHKIVDVIERRGASHASKTTRERRVDLSEKQRRYIREHASSRRTTKTTVTTGAAPRRQTIVVGEEVPQSVEIESFPEDVYREVPVVREYRYIRSGDDVYLVDPGSRRVIEELGD